MAEFAAVPANPTIRQRVYLELNPQAGLNVTSRLVIALILLATAVAIIETEPLFASQWQRELRVVEFAFGTIFAVEYAARIWSAADGPRSRLRYALTPASIIDVVAIIGAFLPFIGPDVLILRLLRVVRMFRLAKLGRFSVALSVLERAIRSRAAHLWVAFSLAAFFLIISATLMYWVEGPHQPAQFGSILRSLWWAVSTMTTVGYGDVVPSTPVGKLIGGFISMSGIALIAIPTGIFAAAFSDELHNRRGS